MPTVVIPGLEKPVVFHDSMSGDEIDAASAKLWRERNTETRSDVTEDTGKGRVASAIASFQRAGAEAMGQVVGAAGRVGAFLTAPVPEEIVAGDIRPEAQAEALRSTFEKSLEESSLAKLGTEIQQGAEEAFRPNPAYKGEFLADVIPQALATTAVSGAAAAIGGPIAGGLVYGGMQGEQASQEAIAAGKPEAADLAFVANLPVGAITEGLLGAGPMFWKIIKKAREAGLEAGKIVPELVKTVSKTAGFEAAQEGAEQVLQNAIAAKVYEPNRPILEGVGTSMAAGAVVGGAVGGAAGIIGRSAQRETLNRVATETALKGAPATAKAIESTAAVTLPTAPIPIPPKLSRSITANIEASKVETETGASRIEAEVQKLLDTELQKAGIVPASPNPPATPTGQAANALPGQESESQKSPAPLTSEQQVPPVSETTPVGTGAGTMPSATSTKNAIVDEERFLRGLAAIDPETVQKNEDTLRNAIAAVNANPSIGDEIVEELNNGTVKAISLENEAILLVHKMVLMNRRAELESVLANESASIAVKSVAESELKTIEVKMQSIDQATHASGAIWGRFGQFRQRMLRADFSLEAIERRTRIAKDGPLTKEELDTIKKQAGTIAELQSRIDDLHKQQNDLIAQHQFETEFGKILDQVDSEQKIEPQIRSIAERIVSVLEDQASKARVRLREKLGRASAGIDPTILSDVVIIGTAKLARGALNFARWSNAMVADLGENVKPYLQEAWTKSNAALDERIEKTAGKTKSEKVKAAVVPATPVEKIESSKTRIANSVGEGVGFEDLGNAVQNLAKLHVAAGINEREALVDAVHADIVAIIPGITRRQVMDAISGYGKQTKLSKEENAVTLRGIKGELQQLAKIEDMEAKMAPKKTGQERRVPTDEERNLIKKVNELKKAGGYVVTDPETQLKSAMDGIKTRLRNEIADIDKAIADNERIANRRKHVEYDAEAKALKAERDAKKKVYEDVFQKPLPTQDERIASASQSLDRSIARLTSEIQNGRIAGLAKGRPLSSPELDAKRAQLEDLKAINDFLQKADVATRENAKIKQLTARKAQLEQRLSEGQRIAPDKEAPFTTPAIEKLRSEIDAISKQISDSEKGPTPSAEDLALARKKAALRRSLAKGYERIANNDFAPKVKPDVKTDDEIRLLTLEQNKVKKAVNEGIFAHMLANRSKKQIVYDTTREVLNVSRNLLTGYEFSAVGRQGWFFSSSRPISTSVRIGKMIKALMSEEYANKVQEEILNRPNAEIYQKAKLFLADVDNFSMNKVEEQYAGRWSSKLPGNVAFQRAFTTFLNLLRADMFDSMTNSFHFREQGLTLDQSKVIASFINTGTGRGSLDLGVINFETSANNLAAVFFAPRFTMSRFQLITLKPLWSGGGAQVKKAIAMEYARALIGMGLFSALVGAYFDHDPIETDPRSSDFGKVKVGDTRIDVMAGLLQSSTFLAKTTTLSTVDKRGRETTLHGKTPFGRDDWFSMAMRFGRTKLAPGPATIVNLLTGKDVTGKVITVPEALAGNLVNITYGDIYQAIKENGVSEGLPMAFLSIFGFGLNTYEKR